MVRRFVDWGKVALLFLFCLSLSISVLITDQNFTFSHLKKEAVEPTRQYLGFVFDLAAFPAEFTGNEASHMRDVAWLLRFAAVLSLVLGVALVRTVKRNEWAKLSKNALVVFAITGVAGLAIPFNTIFRMFHLIFFPQGNWMFAFDSTLILFYPLEFFEWYALCWFGYALFTAIVIALFSRAVSR